MKGLVFLAALITASSYGDAQSPPKEHGPLQAHQHNWHHTLVSTEASPLKASKIASITKKARPSTTKNVVQSRFKTTTTKRKSTSKLTTLRKTTTTTRAISTTTSRLISPTSQDFALQVLSDNASINGTYLSLSSYVQNYADYSTTLVSTKSAGSTFRYVGTTQQLEEYNGNSGWTAAIYTPLGSSPLALWASPQSAATYSAYFAICAMGPEDNLITCVAQSGAKYSAIMQTSSQNLYWAPASYNVPSGYAKVSLYASFK